MPKPPPPYPPEIREHVIRLGLTSDKRMSEIAKALVVSYEKLRTWVKRHRVDNGSAPGITTAKRDELRKLRRSDEILREEHEIRK